MEAPLVTAKTALILDFVKEEGRPDIDPKAWAKMLLQRTIPSRNTGV
jgi:hypothetical protein